MSLDGLRQLRSGQKWHGHHQLVRVHQRDSKSTSLLVLVRTTGSRTPATFRVLTVTISCSCQDRVRDGQSLLTNA
jgi:hypothetical protein